MSEPVPPKSAPPLPLRSEEEEPPERAAAFARTSGLLLALAGLPFALVDAWAEDLASSSATVELLGVALPLSILIVVSAWLLPRRPRPGRRLATLSAGALFLTALPLLGDRPMVALFTVLGLSAWGAGLWNIGGRLLVLRRGRTPLHEGRVRGAAWGALALWLFAGLTNAPHGLAETAAIGVAFLVNALLAIRWAVRHASPTPLRTATVVVIAAAAAAALVLHPEASLAAALGTLLAILTLTLVPESGPRTVEGGGWLDPLLGHPERLFVGTFLTLILLGTLFLVLPASTVTGDSIGVIDAAFTSVSAVCVTGLIVRDTPTVFGPFGQGVLLLLIQLGGLGIMTFATAAYRIFGARVSLKHEGAVARLISPGDRGRLVNAAHRILVVTAVSELAGALLLLPSFLRRGDDLAMGAWRALFTSVSAFCNAGFALQTESLVPYQSDPLVLHVVGALIVLGGISPAAIVALPGILRRRPAAARAQARIALAATGVLLVGGFLLILAIEWDGALGGLSVADRLHNAWFQSVTLRTAGFNSVDLTFVRPATLAVMMVLMLIGGSPGGTAGGIKTTTVALLALDIVRTIRGGPVAAFKRHISDRSIRRAAVVASLAVAGFLGGFLAVELSQAIGPRLASFEVMSALGTVGLSLGATARLDAVGKVLIMICMFSGRVGMLTLLMLLSRRQAPTHLGRPLEHIDVG